MRTRRLFASTGVALSVALFLPAQARAVSNHEQHQRHAVSAACERARQRPRSEPAIVVRVCSDVRALNRDGGVTDARAVDLIRGWAFRNIDATNSKIVVRADGTQHVLMVQPDARSWSARRYLKKFDRDAMGVLCGDAAWFLALVYTAFGFASWTYNAGFAESRASHVITLVGVDGEIFAEDAYYDQSVRGRDGTLLDFPTALAKLRDRDFKGVRLVGERPFPARDILLPGSTAIDPEILGPRRSGGPRPRGRPAQVHDCEARDGYWRCKDDGFNWESVPVRSSNFGQPLLDALVAAGWPARIEYLLMVPLGIGSPAELPQSTPLLRRINAAIGSTA